MEKATRKYLAEVAKKAAQTPFRGYIEGKESNLEPIIRFFPKWTLREADGLWCAAFVYYCCREAGFEIPIRPDACKTCHLAGCIAWEELAQGDVKSAFGREACTRGLTVRCYRVPRLLTDLNIARGDGSYNKLMKDLV